MIVEFVQFLYIRSWIKKIFNVSYAYPLEKGVDVIR